MITASLCLGGMPRGYAPIVISTDRYSKQEGVGSILGSRVAGVLVEDLVSCRFCGWMLSPALLLESRGP